MNHIAITWWANDTMYWLNLMGLDENKQVIASVCLRTHKFVCVEVSTYLDGLV